MPVSKKINYRKHREQLGLTQAEYWGRIGLQQSTGSRYEGGRKPHGSTVLLHQISFGDVDDAARVIVRVRDMRPSFSKLLSNQLDNGRK